MRTEEIIKNHEICVSILENIKTAEMLIAHNQKSLKSVCNNVSLKSYALKLIHHIDILHRSKERLFERYNKTFNNLIK